MADHGHKRTKGVPWDDHHESSESHSAGEGPHRDPDDMLDETSADSFPASDPPSFTPTKAGSGREDDVEGVERERPSGDERRGGDVERESDQA